MSHALYSTRLHWSGSLGFAKLHGVLVALNEPPTFARRAVTGVDYIPEVGMRSIAFGGAERTMTDAEVAEADTLLRQITA
jgi:hypothetical protein